MARRPFEKSLNFIVHFHPENANRKEAVSTAIFSGKQ